MKFIDSSELVSPNYFTKDKDFHLNLLNGRLDAARIKRKKVTISTDEIIKKQFFIPDEVRTQTATVSQLGLKELWVGGSANKHNRWIHSCGVFNVGIIWLSALRLAGRVPKLPFCFQNQLSTFDDIAKLVGSALLLHDFGHLPFSHLLDEILQWVNWVPSKYAEWGSEAAVLEKRFSDMDDAWNVSSSRLGADFPLSSTALRKAIELLILGKYGTPWIQTIVNSPIDADKIDYIRFDSHFLREYQFGLSQRLHLDKPDQWMEDFLQEQEVNHAGFLCLHGRSAIAAVDLWRERMVMYDRFYLSPDLRVPERMAYEIVQQFLIRATMSPSFAKQAGCIKGQDFVDVLEGNGSPSDAITPKYNAVCSIMNNMRLSGAPKDLEFETLEKMHEALKLCHGMDTEYKGFLSRCFGILQSLKNNPKLREVVEHCMVRGPITFPRHQYDDARDIIRPLQHTYCREALIDLVRLPRVLSGPRAKYCGFRGKNRALECQIIVPKGPVTSWGLGRRASVPLTDDCVEDLEIPICRVIVISPDASSSSHMHYVWDRVRSALLDGGIDVSNTE
ncbi:MAG: HD domain-containing protein [Sulfobacillus sp.]